MTRLMNAALILTCALVVLSATTMMRGQTSQNVRYPTMLDMTFPEFEAAVKKTTTRIGETILEVLKRTAGSPAR